MQANALDWMTAVQSAASTPRRTVSERGAERFSELAQEHARETAAAAHRTAQVRAEGTAKTNRAAPASTPAPTKDAKPFTAKDTAVAQRPGDGAKRSSAGRTQADAARARPSDVRRDGDAGKPTDVATPETTTGSEATPLTEAASGTDGEATDQDDHGGRADVDTEEAAAGPVQPGVRVGLPTPPDAAMMPATAMPTASATTSSNTSEHAVVGTTAANGGRVAEGAGLPAAKAGITTVGDASQGANLTGTAGAAGQGPSAAPEGSGLVVGLAEHGVRAPTPTTAPLGTSTTPAAQPALPAMPLGSVPVEIGMRALAGMNRFDIRLDPVELGRIDVRLEIDKSKGAVKAHLTVDRPETMALLQRDTSRLGEALAQAGLTPGDGDINVSLRDASQDGGRSGGQGGSGGDAPRSGPASSAAEVESGPRTAAWRGFAGASGVDIRI